jgi:hypothetical protein
MIYLIITTSIHNKSGIKNSIKRRDDYLSAIAETLTHLPNTIVPVIVENNGQRETYLDNFMHNGKAVPVIYTDNNRFEYKSKGINEALDIKEVIKQMGIGSHDMIIKLTGRYRVFSSVFFDDIIENMKSFIAGDIPTSFKKSPQPTETTQLFGFVKKHNKKQQQSNTKTTIQKTKSHKQQQ